MAVVVEVGVGWALNIPGGTSLVCLGVVNRTLAGTNDVCDPCKIACREVHVQVPTLLTLC